MNSVNHEECKIMKLYYLMEIMKIASINQSWKYTAKFYLGDHGNHEGFETQTVMKFMETKHFIENRKNDDNHGNHGNNLKIEVRYHEIHESHEKKVMI